MSLTGIVSKRSVVATTALVSLALGLFEVACGSQGAETVGASSNELHIYYQCVSTGACDLASESACTSTPGCVWTPTCAPGWCPSIQDESSCNSFSIWNAAPAYPCTWENGACTTKQDCSSITGLLACEHAGCSLVDGGAPPAGCHQATPCPKGAGESACTAANPQCVYTRGVTGGSGGGGGCQAMCGQLCC
jgi:hypothetical protein